MSNDDDFKQYAAAYAKEDQEKKANKSGGFTTNYEEVKWTGLEPQRTKVVRVLGGVPEKNDSKYDAKIRNVAWIKGDDGKQFRCILPSRQGSDHILWSIINRVKDVTYINKKRVFVNETKHKDIFDMVVHNGLIEGDPKRRYNRGWEGRNVIIMNVLDREQEAWHKENKHSMLLSRNINEGANGSVFIDEGVPAYGFYDQIVTTLFKNYGNWENYDIGITRTGEQQSPYRLVNATAFAAANLPELADDLKPFVKQEKLTDEERGYVRYDLDKIFGVSTYTKIWNKLNISIKTIDARLGTNFASELEFLMEEEKKARAEKYAEEGTENAETASTETVTETAKPEALTSEVTVKITERTPQREVKTEATDTGVDVSALKGFDKLDQASKDAIVEVKTSAAGAVTEILYSSEAGVVACPDCSIPSPTDFQSCPNCGLSFI